MQINIKTNFPNVISALDGMRKDVGERSMASALNKTMAKAKTQMAREITSEYRVTSSYVKDRLKVTRASASGGRTVIAAELSGSGRNGRSRSANLIGFLEGSITMAQARKRMKAGEGGKYQLRGRDVQKLLQLRFQIRKTGGKKTIKGAFIGNQGRTVFIRTGSQRLPIKALSTIDIPSMFNQKRINARVLSSINSEFPRIFASEAKYFTDRFNANR